MKILVFGSVLLFSLGGVCSPAAAQKPQPATASAAHTIRLDVNVQDASGLQVPGLHQNDFSVLDNGIAHPIASFHAITDKSTTSMVIVIDAVNAPTDAIAFQRNQLLTFLRANGGHLPQPTSIGILTDQTVRFSGQPTTNGDALADELAHADIGLRILHRDAGFYGAEEQMNASLKALRVIMANQSKVPGRKLVVWISPGWPLLSGIDVELTTRQQAQLFENIIQFSTQLREAQITVYDVNTWGASESIDQALYYKQFVKGVRKASQTELGDLGLQVLALQTGGLVQNSNNLDKMLEKCEDDAGPYYEISMQAPAFDKRTEYHALTIRVDHPGLTARTRSGYYVAP